MKKYLKLLCAACILFVWSACHQKETFSLTGKTQNFKNGEFLYLRMDSDIIDSAKVVDNQFEFNTEFDSFPTQVILMTKDFQHYRFLWLEDSEMTFDASNSNFKEAIVEGSETEALSVQLSKLTQSYDYGDPMKIKVMQDFVKEHPNSVISANILSILSSTWGKDTTEELYQELSDNLKSTKYGKEIKQYIDLAVEPEVGDAYVNFTMNDVDGNPVQLSDYEGKVVLLEFWASWCEPCRRENPNLVRTYQKYKEQGFEVLGVSLDESKESWLKAIEKDELPWQHISDLKGDQNKASIIYGVSGIPDNFLIDQNGKIIYRNLRGKQLDDQLEEIFGTP
jgi:peroxiredoxin